LIAALPPLVFAESEIPGWGKAKWGMSYAEVSKLYELSKWEAGDTPISKLKNRIKSVWRYKEFLPPIDKKDIVTLGEGFTSITNSKTIKKELNLEELSFKLE